MTYIPGSHYCQCDRCGFRNRIENMKLTWDNWLVCSSTCWEDKHPSLLPHKLSPDREKARVTREEKSYFIEPEE